MKGRAFEIVQIGDGHMLVAASDLGLPKDQFPRSMRLRNEDGKPRWFDFARFEDGAAVYKSGETTLVVVPA